jgi:NitT/TauT family transport system substrate-binding protein
MRALLAGRVAGSSGSLRSGAEVVKQGNFKVLIEPWQEYKTWLSEPWLVHGAWADNKDNLRAAVDLNKAMIKSFRMANADYGYWADGFRKYATVPDAAKATDETLKPIWQKLSTAIKAWPNDGGFKREYFKDLLPVYRKAGAIKGRSPISIASSKRDSSSSASGTRITAASRKEARKKQEKRDDGSAGVVGVRPDRLGLS